MQPDSNQPLDLPIYKKAPAWRPRETTCSADAISKIQTGPMSQCLNKVRGENQEGGERIRDSNSITVAMHGPCLNRVCNKYSGGKV